MVIKFSRWAVLLPRLNLHCYHQTTQLLLATGSRLVEYTSFNPIKTRLLPFIENRVTGNIM